MAVIGYARVSTEDQDFARQIEEIEAAGSGRVHSEKVGGTRAARPHLAKVMATIKAGDTIMVTVDRLGHSTRELLDLIHWISKAGASLKRNRRSLGRVPPQGFKSLTP